MKSAKIFLVEGERKLTPMTETNYVKEDDLQALLASYLAIKLISKTLAVGSLLPGK